MEANGGCSRSVAGAHRRRGGAASSRKGLRPEGRGRSRRPCREPRGSHGRRGTGSTDKNAARCGGDSVAWQAACTAGVPGFALPPGFRPGSASRRQWEGRGRSRSFSGRWGGAGGCLPGAPVLPSPRPLLCRSEACGTFPGPNLGVLTRGSAYPPTWGRKSCAPDGGPWLRAGKTSRARHS